MMRKSIRVAACLAAALVSCASAPALVRAQAPDSVRLMGSWTPVRQANGQLVPGYRARFVLLRPASDTIIWAGTVTDTLAQLTVARPAAGDSARYRLQVRAYDVRGDSSLIAQSPIVVLRRPWLPPPPPVVRLDTIPVNLAVSTLQIYAARGDTALHPPFTLRVGETLPFLPGGNNRGLARPGDGPGPARAVLRPVS